MSIKSLKSGLYSNSVITGNAVILPGDFESIATANPSGTATVTFSSISSTYQHLQVRLSVLGSAAGNAVYLRFNNDSTYSYPSHYIYGNGATVSVGGATAANSANGAYIGDLGTGLSTSNPMIGIVDILDYSSSNKYKTIKNLGGIDQNGSGSVDLISNLWISTSIINRIDIVTSGGNFNSGSIIALYGIRG